MEAITGFLEDFDFAKLLPELGKFLTDLRFWTNFIMICLPLVLLGFGIWYFFFPVKEANHSVGFRIYFGMGSVQAWQFTQRLAGLLWMIMGGVFTVVSIVICLCCIGSTMMGLVTTAVVWLAIVALLVIASYFTMQGIVISRFDKDGNPRTKA